MNRFYVTTAIDYVNDVIHIGHAYQKVTADVLARYYRQKLGKENVYFLTGTDEHGAKAEEAAREAGKPVKTFVDEIAAADQKEQASLNISYNRFIRTTDLDHVAEVVDFWKKAEKSGDIYLGDFTGKYCRDCESFKTDSDLTNGRCPFHSAREIEIITEKNYFFRWKKYAPFLKEHIEKHEDFVRPVARRNEILAFVDKIEDITVSRKRESVGWGIEVPGDSSQIIYVWFDALINYLTAGRQNGFWDEETKIIHILGKDNLRWHALLWPAMLKSAGYRLPDTIYAHGFLTFNGQKISKSLGNVIRPTDLVNKYGLDPVRYYLLSKANFADDSDISVQKLEEAHNGDLANGLGNFTARVLTLALKIDFAGNEKVRAEIDEKIKETRKVVKDKIDNFKFHEALAAVWGLISFGDSYVNEKKPWESQDKGVIFNLVVILDNVAALIAPFLPGTAEKITKNIEWHDGSLKVKKTENLFPRIK